MSITFGFIEDWSQIWDKCNWYEFHFVSFYIENTPKLGLVEFQFAFLGLGFYVTWEYKDTKFKRELEDEAESFIKDLEA